MSNKYILLGIILMILTNGFAQNNISNFSTREINDERIPKFKNPVKQQIKEIQIINATLKEGTDVNFPTSKNTRGGGIVMDESFEGDWPPAGWKIVNNGVSQWTQDKMWGNPSGTACAFHKWETIGSSNNWIISPKVLIDGENYVLKFSSMLNFHDTLMPSVHISKGSPDPANNEFVEIYEIPRPQDSWHQNLSVDLSAYNGDSVHFGFYIGGVAHSWRVDNIFVAPSSFTDAALTGIASPSGYELESGLRDITVTLKNLGTTKITDFSIKWKVNGVEMGTASSEGTGLSINPGKIYNLTIGEYDFHEIGNYDIEAELILADDVELDNDKTQGEFSVGFEYDLEVLEISPEGSFPLNGEQSVKVKIKNNGTSIIDSIDVNWAVNDIQNTPVTFTNINLLPNSSTLLEIGKFDFQDGVNSIDVNIPYNYDNNTESNSKSATIAINCFFEDFQGAMFPPAGWDANDTYLHNQDPLHWDPENFYMTSADSHMARSPLLNIEPGDSITYYTAYGGSLYLVNGTTGDSIFLQPGGGIYSNYNNPTVHIGDYPGNHYLVWDLSNNGRVDEIYSSATLAVSANDLAVYKSTLSEIEHVIPVDTNLNYTLSVQNLSVDTIIGSSYNVELRTHINDENNLLAMVSGTTLAPNEITDIILTHTFENWDNENLFMTIVSTKDANLGNNTTDTIEIVKVPKNTNHVNIGQENKAWSLNFPWNYGWIFTEDEVDLNQSIYYKSELEKAGYIYGIRYFTDNLGESATNLKVWIGETELNNVDTGYFDPSSFTLVYDSVMHDNSWGRGGSVFVQFKEPYYYDGTKNIVLQHSAQNDLIAHMGNGFLLDQSSTEKRTIFNIGLKSYEPDNLPIIHNKTIAFPLIDFIVDPIANQGYIKGRVTDSEGLAVANAEIRVDNTIMKATTNKDGFYKLPYMLYANYSIIADGFGYEYNTKSIDITKEVMEANFVLTDRATINLSGKIVGSNDPATGLENVNISFSGYNDYNSNTNQSGDFALNQVYGNTLYKVVLSLTGYHTYIIDSVNLGASDYDFGTIEMQEAFLNAISVLTNKSEAEVSIEWVNPVNRTSVYKQVDAGMDRYGFANEPFENVWLGNIFKNNEVITLDSVEIFWTYDSGGKEELVTVDIFDHEGNVLVTSDPFLTPYFEWITIDIPNITISKDYYVMVHWQNNENSSHRLSLDYEWDSENYEPMDDVAFIKYPDQDLINFGEFLGGNNPKYAFLIRSIGAVEQTTKATRSVQNYNIYRGLIEEHAEVTNWTPINSEPLTSTSFIDNEINSELEGNYTYAVEAIYTEGNSDVTFSSLIYHQGLLAPINFTATEQDNKITLAWEAPSGMVESYNVYIDDFGTAIDTVTELSYDITKLAAGNYIAGVSANYSSGTSEITTVQFTTMGVSVHDINSNETLIYPNPANDKIFVENFEGGTIEFYNIIGELQFVQTINNNRSTINISTLDNGMYIVKIVHNNTVQSTKIQKQ